jgi:GntR family galactonate operon transcriptional repressor
MACCVAGRAVLLSDNMNEVFAGDPDAPLAQRSRHEQIVRHLGLSIIHLGAVTPGQALLSEPELCVQLGVSRAMLREAIKVLASKGMVESRPKVGTLVREQRSWNLLDPDILTWLCEAGPSDEFLHSLSELRLVVEPQAARLAALRASDVEIAQLAAICNRMRIALHDLESFATADSQFHSAIAAASHNELLIQLVGAAMGALRGNVDLRSRLHGAPEAALPQYVLVVDRIRSRDGEAAETAMCGVIAMTIPDMDRK